MAPDLHTPKNTPFLAAHYGTQKAIIRRSKNYQESVESIKKTFKDLRSVGSDRISITAWFEEFKDTLQIPEELWPELVPRLMLIEIILSKSSGYSEGEPIYVSVKKGAGEPLTILANPADSVYSIKQTVERVEGIDPCDQTLVFGGTRLSDQLSLADCGIRSGSTLNLLSRAGSFSDTIDPTSALADIFPRGKKPVIYLFPPVCTSNILVQLSLAPAWSFLALHPPTKIVSETTKDSEVGEMAAWVVDAKPDGTLLDKGTSREVAYLFWEAQAERKLLSPAPSRPGSPNMNASTVAFDPSRPNINPHNAALLPFNNITAYLDDALLQLGLHTEARTSFITYWLPDMVEHKHIALRFVPQGEFEKAAPLSVLPKPDIVTRVFMLFRGVDETEIESWAPARAMASQDPSIWKTIVGVDLDRTLNTGLFRVLEWGGMEVK
ncbi:hypothetical protein BDV93DRAFT_481881 [Ceratobasidium sp. AG-I]|nr:hypothetical protein BDV93DRAFT_481881 [Ceratobasidium sp. AG-I]